jgi:hypothetical protein
MSLSARCTPSILSFSFGSRRIFHGIKIQVHGYYILDYYRVKGKDKAVPLQAWSGPEGSRKLRFPDFMTTAQDGGKVVSLVQRPPLPPGNTPGTHFC